MAEFNPAYASAGGLLGAGIGNMFADWENPYEKARPYYEQMQPMLEKSFRPYIEAGQRQIPGLTSEYGSLVGHPGAKLNEIGAGYQQSPGFKFALQQALQGAGHTAARYGMAGSPQHEQQSMELATNLANKDYNEWLSHALGLYGQGLGGEEEMMKTGYGASRGYGEDIASIMAQRAQLEQEAQNAENERSAGKWTPFLAGLGSLAGGALGTFFGGAPGAAAGSTIGGNVATNAANMFRR